MCIAIAKKAGATITDETLKTCYEKNKDGCGFAFIHTFPNGHKKLKIEKYMDYDRFLTRFRRAETNNPDSPFLIHFRIGTAGVKTTFNCHPFKINKNIVFIHNGIIHNVGTDIRKSDTQLFNEKILKELPPNWWSNKAIMSLVEDFIGKGSKLAFLDIDGNFHFSNEHMGTWENNIWYSNTGYKIYTAPTYYSGGAVVHYNFRNQGGATKRDRKNKRSHSIDGLYNSCDHCSSVFHENYLTPAWMDGQMVLLCNKCKKELLITSQISESHFRTWQQYNLYMSSIVDSRNYDHYNYLDC